jgi:hypothetical protein
MFSEYWKIIASTRVSQAESQKITKDFSRFRKKEKVYKNKEQSNTCTWPREKMLPTFGIEVTPFCLVLFGENVHSSSHLSPAHIFPQVSLSQEK